MEYKIIILPAQTVTVKSVPVAIAPEQIAEVNETEVEVKIEKSSDDESFEIEFDTQEVSQEQGSRDGGRRRTGEFRQADPIVRQKDRFGRSKFLKSGRR